MTELLLASSLILLAGLAIDAEKHQQDTLFCKYGVRVLILTTPDACLVKSTGTERGLDDLQMTILIKLGLSTFPPSFYRLWRLRVYILTQTVCVVNPSSVQMSHIASDAPLKVTRIRV